jgi:putative FmdB family regulatory protein
MPTYVYRCAKCGEDLEVYQTFSEEPLKRHAADGGKLTKVLSPVGIVLKGSGFYKNDSGSGARGRKREESSSNGDSSASDAKASNGSDSKASDSKGSDSGSGDSSKSDKSAASSDRKNGEKKSSDKKHGEKKSPVKSS